MAQPKTYHPLLVSLHWLMALFIFMLLFFGKVLLVNTSNAEPVKMFGLTMHASIGLAVGVLLLVRIWLRLRTTTPPPATAGNAVLDSIGKLTHFLLYFVIALMVASGIGMAFFHDLFAILYGGTGAPLPPYFNSPPRFVHGIVADLLIALVGLHIVGAFYHQFIRKDGLFRRMWFNKK